MGGIPPRPSRSEAPPPAAEYGGLFGGVYPAPSFALVRGADVRAAERICGMAFSRRRDLEKQTPVNRGLFFIVFILLNLEILAAEKSQARLLRLREQFLHSSEHYNSDSCPPVPTSGRILDICKS